MRFTNFFIPTKKEVPSDAKLKSHILMIRSGMIRMESSGIYSWLPLGYRILSKIQKIIEIEHSLNNVHQMLMPTIQTSEIWKLSDRYDSYGKEMLKITDRHNKELLYGPTNEEMITVIGKDYIKSYKNLPLYLFHIQSKFRDEIRPRFGVMRAREFIMKDAYSFDVNKIDAQKTYEIFFNMYLKIFSKLGINIIPVKALSGEIGGDLSHEFHIISESGESDIVLEEGLINTKPDLDYDFYKKFYSSTIEYFNDNSEKDIKLISKKSIELGHIFLFGKKYSSAFEFKVNSADGHFNPFMGSYGIGLSRIPAAIIECSNDPKGIIWPKEISPFQIMILNLKTNNELCNNFCESLYKKLIMIDKDTLYDDRDERVGIKFSDADLIGIPVQIIIGKSFEEEETIQLKFRKNGIIKDFKADYFINNIIKILEND